MNEEQFVHLTTVSALWYSRVLYAFESSEERTGSADWAWLKSAIVPDLYQTLVKKTPSQLGLRRMFPSFMLTSAIHELLSEPLMNKHFVSISKALLSR